MEPVKHECGVAMIRLLKPLDYYTRKYGTHLWALGKLYLMMEKEHNRGQEGAGIACVKLHTKPGHEYMFRERALGSNAITEIFDSVHRNISEAEKTSEEGNMPFVGELYMGHLRYSTTGKRGLEYVHPFLRRNNWKAKNLCLCGNFNMTNIDEVFSKITSQGQYPRVYSDGYITLEWMGHRLDREVEYKYNEARELGLEDTDITRYIDDHVRMGDMLRTAMPAYDGGYVICGVTGSGEMFAMRDPWGIRTAFFYLSDDIAVVASERPVLQTCFDLECGDVKELKAGQALVVNRAGRSSLEQIIARKGDSACSFERIYFSRGSDRDIYKERKRLGEQLMPQILNAIDGDVEHTVFSFIPNTAEVAFCGMLESFKQYVNEQKIRLIEQLDHKPTHQELQQILSQRVRSEKVAWKDIKLRTFITEGDRRNNLASHVYDITYESLAPYRDNLVIIDDSIVRGTTLRESIIKILDRLHPKKIIVVSSSPQIRYPDYYGIDMAGLEQFIAFRACMALLKQQGQYDIIEATYHACREELKKPKTMMVNQVKRVYRSMTIQQLNTKMVEMLRPKDVTTPIELVFQSIEGLRKAIPNHKGDWYFTGDYPTPGGTKHVNQAFINYIEKIYQNEQKF